MPWFRVDDTMWSHPKILACAPSAVALWVRAGSWAAQQLTEGHVPASALRMLGGRARDAQQLVDVRLWVVDPDGDGWRFHGWDERQPARAQVLADRAAAADRQRRARERAREQRDDEDSDGPASRRASRRDGGRDTGTGPRQDRARNRTADDDDSEPNEDDPTGVVAGRSVSSRRDSRPPRPGPAHTHLLDYLGRLALGDAHDAGRPPAEQVDAWQAVAGPHVDLVREAAAYLARHGGRPADDPHAAWQGWLRAARRRADEQHRPPIGCDRCAGGWLDDDERGRPRPCPTCKPRHLAAVETREDDIA